METQKPVSFDEFKLYYESAEKVTDRRLELNRWNYSISVAILIAVAAITNWSLQNPPLFWLGIVAACVLCLMAVFFGGLWVGQIVDLKKLNSAKFDVLAEMAPKIEFDLDHIGAVQSYEPFRREWDILQKRKSLVTWGSGSIKVLRASHHEIFVPRAFQSLFVVLFIILAAIAIKGKQQLPQTTTIGVSTTTKTP